MIAKEDVEYEQFLRNNVQVIDLIKTMFSRCLAGILDSNLIIRLFDKVVAGYFRLLLPKIVHYILINEKHHLINDDYSTLLSVRMIVVIPFFVRYNNDANLAFYSTPL